MILLALIFLPMATIVFATIAVLSVIRGDDELAGLAAGHMAACALANIGCWFVM